MSKCNLLEKGCDCGSTEAAKCQSSKKRMKSREEIEEAIIRMEAEIEKGLDVFHEIYYQNKIEALKWVLNTQ